MLFARTDGTTPIDSIKKQITRGQDNTVPFQGKCNMCISKPKGLLIDDFDDGNDINLLGFKDGAFWYPDKPEIIDTFYIHQPPENVLRGTGGSLKINFNVSDSNAFGGWLTTLNDGLHPTRGTSFNLANLNLDSLTFWVKAENPDTYFEVALKDSTHNCLDNNRPAPCQTDRKEIRSVGTSWKRVSIPISDLLRGPNGVRVDSTRLHEINFAFGYARFQELRLQHQKNVRFEGTIYLDEIAFER